VSNPPYIADGDRHELQPEVRDWEPADALFAGDEGLDVIRHLIAGAPARLLAGGLLAIECGLGQSERIVTDLDATGAFSTVRIRPDLTGRPRVVLAERRSDSSTD
jgi:release factor glutamine methyltransferase